MLSRIGLAAFAVVATVSSTQASSITPDMWVYDLVNEGVSANMAPLFAETWVPAGSVVPPGCSATQTASGDSHLECSLDGATSGGVFFEGEAFELDLSKKYSYFSKEAWNSTIAFNKTGVVCRGPVRCPDGFSTLFEWDYATGRLSYDTWAMTVDEEWDVSLDPDGGSFSGNAFSLGISFGSWDYGTGGRFSNRNWWGADVYVGGSAVLVQAPSAVPLPAAGWMLLTALGLVVGGAKRRGALMHKSGERSA